MISMKGILRAIERMDPDDLNVIEKAWRRRWGTRNAAEARTEAACEAFMQAWPVGSVLYSHNERQVLHFGPPPKRSHAVSTGERLIVRQYRPRAHDVCFERPDRSEWNGYLMIVSADSLAPLDLRPEPPTLPATEPRRGPEERKGEAG